jgi:hypothetical protein
MTTDRRGFAKSLVAAAGALTAGRWYPLGRGPVVAAQTVALKDLVPKGWLIGTGPLRRVWPRSRHGGDRSYARVALADAGLGLGGGGRWACRSWNDARTDALAYRHGDGPVPGKIRGWDVVNEALNDDGTLRDSPWRHGIGDDYIAKAFEFAREADPGAELYYNDSNLATRPAKRAGAIRIIEDLQRRGLRIDAVGEQGHWRRESPTTTAIDETFTELRATGVKVMITELDVNLLPPAAPPAPGPPRQPAANPYVNGLPDEVQRALARCYANAFRVFLAHRDDITRVTFWGVSDGDVAAVLTGA